MRGANPRYIFPIIINSFPEDSQLRSTGIFYIGSGLALFSAIICLFFFPDIRQDAMIDEDRLFREYLIENGIDITGMGMTRKQSPGNDTIASERKLKREDVDIKAVERT